MTNRGFHEVRVKSRQKLTPGMVRVTFTGAGLSDLEVTGIGDEYLRLFFADPKTGRTVLPEIGEDGSWNWPEGGEKPHSEPYTVRRFDAEAAEMDIDFVVHEGGIASEWAQAAEPGMAMTITNPHGLYELPGDARWQILVCDATGLPAAARLLEQAPSHVQSRVIVEVAGADHEQVLALSADDSVTWLHGSGNGVGPGRLEEALRLLPIPATPGYIWSAGEQKSMRAIRRYLRHELKLPSHRYKVVGYWIDKLDAWQSGWDALDTSIREKIDAAWASDRDREDVRDEVEATLEKHGL